MLAPKHYIQEIGGYDDLFPLEDWDLALKLSEIGDVYVLPDVLGIKRLHSGNYSKSHPNIQTAFEVIKDRHRLDIPRLPRISEL